MSNQIQLVQFHNQQISILNYNNKPYVAIKPICENIGLDWEAQRQRIKRNEILNSTAFMIKVVAKDGKNRDVLCLPLGYLNGWLAGIELSRVNPEIKPILKQYQLECFDVLYSHFMPKVAQQHPNTISLEQQQAIQQAVNERVYRTGERHQAVYSKFHQQFKIPRYQDLPASKFDEAIKWLGGITLRDYKSVNIDNLKRQYNYIGTIQEYYYRIFDLYNDCLADFLEKNSPHLHYNFSTALNKIQVNLSLSMNFVRGELDICNARKTLV
ncbi:ORF6C domain-containing protein [Gilliamella sp. B2776]|uniref:phage antirepressor N-terminal domain-containing protein n=3 Tax=Gilliamella TaxID=1193503 RepID=UPI0022698361|nr:MULTISPECIES: phage antirepressor N-terminal domain-containing protein [unclassified Gilliamella]MCX8649950.1 ORF6C domain-containing protein [Gilliamella sp. B2779]MCX8691723.1 ORF6C domain-containing protein [Gilliamella sp. B2776]MCX8703036.1 ORF6C domain-containing protein [Gilliamella sp. B2781]